MSRLSKSGIFRTLASILLASIIGSQAVQAAITGTTVTVKELNISLSTELTVPVTEYSANNKTLLIWIPSEFGIFPKKQAPVARGLSMRGIDVWYADLHDAYFVQRGRNSVDKFKATDIGLLMLKAIDKGYTKITLIGSAGSARPLLRAARYWQSKNSSSKNLKHLNTLVGLILFHPSLYASRPDAGVEAQFIPETFATNVPVYIIQPTFSTAIYRVRHLLKSIRSAGAPVWIHFLHDVKDGFQANISRHQRQIDIKTRQQLPSYLASAIKRMSLKSIPSTLAVLPKYIPKTQDTLPGLKPFNAQTIRTLSLTDIKDKTKSLKSFRGEVLLVSFWASWCPPCIREMPSINRLSQHFKNKKFRVVSVNIGETKADINKFLNKHSLRGEVLMDPTLNAYKKWKIYVIPSNFLIDKNGKMRYTSIGAVDWDTKPIRNIINKLIAE